MAKLPCMGAVAAPSPQIGLYFVRYKRRRLALTPVEVDPDAEAAAEAAAGGAATAASVLCAGPARAKAGAELDF